MNNTQYPFTDTVNQLPSAIPFVGPEALERQLGAPFQIRIGANESCFGVSPKAAAAMNNAIAQVAWYGDPENYDLRTALAAHHQVNFDEICVAGGIDEFLGLMVRLVTTPGTPIVTSLGGYPTFNYHVKGYGGELHQVPYTNDHNDLQALADKAKQTNAPLVYLANPDNPMGTWYNADTIQSFINSLPASCLLILDEAYIEFAPEGVDFPIDTSVHNVVRMRTFSKAHGMAGARVGYALGASEMMTGLNKIRNQFAVNRIAQAGALASLQDQEFVQSVIQQVAVGREEYYQLANDLGLESIPSATNFVAIDVGGDERARNILKELQQRSIFIRMPGVEPLDRCVRVTVGTDQDRTRFTEVFRDVLKTV